DFKPSYGFVCHCRLLLRDLPTTRKRGHPTADMITDRWRYSLPDLRPEGAFLVRKLAEGLETGGGDFFRKLADAIEVQAHGPADPVRYLLANHALLVLNGEVPIGFRLTAKEWHQTARLLGVSSSARTIRRACEQVGLPLAKGKRSGRPRKS